MDALRAEVARLQELIAVKEQLLSSRDQLLASKGAQLAMKDELLAAKDQLLASKEGHTAFSAIISTKAHSSGQAKVSSGSDCTAAASREHRLLIEMKCLTRYSATWEVAITSLLLVLVEGGQTDTCGTVHCTAQASEMRSL
jgi:hypothetical protein